MNVITINSLTKRYNNGFLALDSLNLSIFNGDFFAILGRNGAGKSTIIGILTSLIKKSSGKIYFYSYDLDYDLFYIKNLIGVVFQDFNLNQFDTVYNSIINCAGFYGLNKFNIIDRINMLLDLFELSHVRNSYIITLSGGMKKRLMLIKALIHNPEILILDEPTAGVDLFSRKIILDFLKELKSIGKTIILTTHYLEEVESLCNRVAIIEQGNLLKEAVVNDLYLTNRIFIFVVDDVLKIKIFFDFKIKILDKNNFELFLFKDQKLNIFLQHIINQNVIIHDIINKNSSLEDFFINSLKI